MPSDQTLMRNLFDFCFLEHYIIIIMSYFHRIYTDSMLCKRVSRNGGHNDTRGRLIAHNWHSGSVLMLSIKLRHCVND